jgi:hypothetical protein
MEFWWWKRLWFQYCPAGFLGFDGGSSFGSTDQQVISSLGVMAVLRVELEKRVSIDLLFAFVGCTCLWPTCNYVGLLDPTGRTFEQVFFRLSNYFIFIFISLIHVLMASLLIAKYVPTNISLVAIGNASIHQHIIQTSVSFARV